MTTYYYDDNSEADHWRTGSFETDEQATKWVERWQQMWPESDITCILYCDGKDGIFRTVKKWKT